MVLKGWDTQMFCHQRVPEGGSTDRKRTLYSRICFVRILTSTVQVLLHGRKKRLMRTDTIGYIVIDLM